MDILVRYKGNVVLAERVVVTDLPEYRIWCRIHSRCRAASGAHHKNYVLRGITVCERWNSFELFYLDVGPRPTEQHSIERKNNDLGYTPDNCKWARIDEQNSNRSNTVWVEFEGKRVKLMELVRRLNLDRQMVHSRIKLGWPVEDAIKLPKFTHRKVGNDRRRKHPVLT